MVSSFERLHLIYLARHFRNPKNSAEAALARLRSSASLYRFETFSGAWDDQMTGWKGSTCVWDHQWEPESVQPCDVPHDRRHNCRQFALISNSLRYDSLLWLFLLANNEFEATAALDISMHSRLDKKIRFYEIRSLYKLVAYKCFFWLYLFKLDSAVLSSIDPAYLHVVYTAHTFSWIASKLYKH